MDGEKEWSKWERKWQRIHFKYHFPMWFSFIWFDNQVIFKIANYPPTKKTQRHRPCIAIVTLCVFNCEFAYIQKLIQFSDALRCYCRTYLSQKEARGGPWQLLPALRLPWRHLTLQPTLKLSTKYEAALRATWPGRTSPLWCHLVSAWPGPALLQGRSLWPEQCSGCSP